MRDRIPPEEAEEVQGCFRVVLPNLDDALVASLKEWLKPENVEILYQ